MLWDSKRDPDAFIEWCATTSNVDAFKVALRSIPRDAWLAVMPTLLERLEEETDDDVIAQSIVPGQPIEVQSLPAGWEERDRIREAKRSAFYEEWARRSSR